MSAYLAKKALLPDGWKDDVLISVDGLGFISEVQAEQPHGDGRKAGIIVPAMPNLHSHAFQRAMAGQAEYKTADQDSFWTWRKAMYGFLQNLGPEEMEETATNLYREMRQAGYGCVGEFHYIHHQPDGAPYDDPAEMSHRMIRAAKKAGIAITHMPVLYACGGFGGQRPEDGQKRFINSPEGILDIVASLYREYKDDPQVQIGFAFHSLRAVTKEMMDEILLALADIDPRLPVHIHIAEQEKEVADCLAWSGRRPVEWLLDNFEVGAHWCLVHATHMNEQELRDVARSGATVGLCPTTEANLGDGVFDLKSYIAHGGRFGIGSDSHISVDPREELRLLEYGQRLVHKQRNVACSEDEPHSGSFLYKAALEGGAAALGQKTGRIEPGYRADWITIDESSLSGCDDPAFFLDRLVFRV